MQKIAYLYVAGTVVLTVYGQLVLKWRIGGYGALPEPFKGKLGFLFGLLADPYILSGLLAAFAASLFWMAAMTKLELSVAYPLTLTSLVLVMVFSVLLFGEPITWQKIAGMFLIGAGVLLIGQSR